MTKQASKTEKPAEVASNGSSIWGRLGVLIIVLAVAGFMAVFGYGYFELSKVNISLAHTMTSVEEESTTAQQSINNLRETMAALEEKVTASQDVSEEHNQIISEWKSAQKGDIDKWHLAEAHYLVRMADDQIKFMHDPSQAVVLLQRANKVLDKVKDSRAGAIQESIADDLTKLQAIQPVDTAAIFTQLTSLEEDISKLPLPSEPLKMNATQASNTDIPSDTPWWKAGLLHSWNTIRQFVVVRNVGDQGMPLIFPEEKTFLYQNLQASLQNAKWAVLHHNNDVFQSSLTTAVNWIKKYFAQDTSETNSVLDSLAELQKLDIQPAMVDLETTLQLFKQDHAATVSSEPQRQASAVVTKPEPEPEPAPAPQQTAAATEPASQPQVNGQ